MIIAVNGKYTREGIAASGTRKEILKTIAIAMAGIPAFNPISIPSAIIVLAMKIGFAPTDLIIMKSRNLPKMDMSR